MFYEKVYADRKEKVTPMRVLVLSDTHRSLGYACDCIERESPDVVLHLGDHLSDAEELSYAYDEPDFYYVPGNCDYAPTVQPSLTLELGGVRIFMTHGHLFGVKQDVSALLARAKELGAQIALFGHTHIAMLEQREGVWLMNPGTAGRLGRTGCGVIEIQDGSFRCRLEHEAV